MATHPKVAPGIRGLDSFLSYVTRRLPEGASETFLAGSPVALSSGLVVEATSPVSTTNKVIGIAQRDGQNGTGKISEVALLLPGYSSQATLWANFLGASGADNNIAAADLGTKFDFIKTSTLWHIEDGTGEAIAQIISRDTDYHGPNTAQNSRWEVGDTNARVEFIFIPTVLQYGT